MKMPIQAWPELLNRQFLAAYLCRSTTNVEGMISWLKDNGAPAHRDEAKIGTALKGRFWVRSEVDKALVKLPLHKNSGLPDKRGRKKKTA